MRQTIDKVAVIGAGPVGLAVARGLKKNGVPHVQFEAAAVPKAQALVVPGMGHKVPHAHCLKKKRSISLHARTTPDAS